MPVSAARPSIRALPTERNLAEGWTKAQRVGREITAAPVQEGEEKEKEHPREEM